MNELQLSEAAAIERALEQFVQFGQGCPLRLAAAMRHSLMAGGKRLRPMLVLRSAVMCGASSNAGMPAACAVEMVHTYSLIHDDLPAMDNDVLRRGKPTCHIAFDEATAILAGDALLARAFEILATEYPAEIAARSCAELASSAGACRLVGGQCDDLSQTETLSVSTLESINERKTASLIGSALRLGGLVAQTSPSHLAGLTECGRNLGLAFQIVDDLLDRRGTEVAMGKPTGSDVRRGKTTFPDLIGIDECLRRVEKLYAGACRALAEFGDSAKPLLQLAEQMVHRDR